MHEEETTYHHPKPTLRLDDWDINQVLAEYMGISGGQTSTRFTDSVGGCEQVLQKLKQEPEFAAFSAICQAPANQHITVKIILKPQPFGFPSTRRVTRQNLREAFAETLALAIINLREMREEHAAKEAAKMVRKTEAEKVCEYCKATEGPGPGQAAHSLVMTH